MVEAVHMERDVPGVGLIEYDDQPVGSPTLKGHPRKVARRCYHLTTEDGVRRELPSVTTVLNKVVPKPNLMRWYEAQGAEATLALERAGSLAGIDPGGCIEVVRGLGYGAEDALRSSGRRGTAVHAIAERYWRDEELPNLGDYPQEWHGFIRALARFLMDHDVVPDEDGTERLVCHPELGYAGRLDARVSVNGTPGVLLDLKTNTRGTVYSDHHLQTIAYALGDERCGADPVTAILIVALGENGRYEVHPGVGTPEAWEAVMALYHHQAALAEAIRRAEPHRVVVEVAAA